jgi:uncharacterized protein (PEP-CTERM system associated)
MIVLTGWMTAAGAQDAGIEPVSPNPAQGDTTDAMQNLLPGVVPQPTPESPGLVTGVTLGELYTDNLRLAGPGKNKQSSWITEIQPFVKAATGSPRFSGTVDYSITGYLYTGGSHAHQVAQDLKAQGVLTVVPDHFFVAGNASYGRAVVNNAMPSGAGTFFLDNNRANVATASLSPYWIQELGNIGTATIRYTHGRVAYNTRGIPGESQSAPVGPINLDHPSEDRTVLAGISNVNSDAVQANLVSPEGRRFGWNIAYSEQRLDYGSGWPAARFAIAKGGVYWQLNVNTRLLADAGKENKYLPDGTIETLAAPFWDAGFQWSSTRDSVKVLVGHRFFGRSGEFSWSHTAALLTTTVSYTEQPTDLNQQLLGQNPGSVVLPPINAGQQIPSLAERRVYLMKRAMASASYEMPHGRLSLTLFDESRRYITLDNAREKVANADLAWLFEIGPYTTLTPTWGWQRYRFRGGQVNYTQFGQLALVHQINPNNFGSLRYRNDSRDVYYGTPGAHGYRVNVLFLEWTHLF